ncbi:MAG: serine/threonine protein kinase [Deltaproteobacteria bacterium]|nr:serine/threonine protein kinase [Deltaproteobacteria bacterium]
MESQTTGRYLFGPFLVERMLARGGMAEVLLAQERGLQGFRRRVVIKRVLPHLADDPEFVAMFNAEARLAARLVHPGIVHVYEFGCYEGSYFLSMEYVEGASLAQIARRLGTRRLPIEHALKIVASICEALQYTHTLRDEESRPLGLVHRDVSPQNILVSVHGTVKLADFGIAKATESSTNSTRAGTIKGKFAYMAPERLMGTGADLRSDIFSAGVVLWELLTGSRLYAANEPGQIVTKILSDPVPNVGDLAPGIPPEFDAIVARALAKRPEDRYPNAAQMQMDIERGLSRAGLLSNAPLLAEFLRESGVFTDDLATDPAPPPECAPAPTPEAEPGVALTTPTSQVVVRPPARRHRLGAALGGVAIAAAVAALLFWVPWRRGTAETSRSSREEPRAVVAAAPAMPAAAPALPGPTPAGSASASPAPAEPAPAPTPAAQPAPTSAAGATAVTTVAPRAAPAPGPTAGAVAAPRHATGLVSIDSTPWSRVYFRGRLLGETPIAEAALPVGSQRLVFEYGEGQRHSILVRVREDETVRSRIRLP